VGTDSEKKWHAEAQVGHVLKPGYWEDRPERVATIHLRMLRGPRQGSQKSSRILWFWLSIRRLKALSLQPADEVSGMRGGFPCH
jgi:hypothetical protein